MAVNKVNPHDVVINVTPVAHAHLQQQLSEHPNAIGVRLSTKKTGCSGLSYVTTVVDKPENDDIQAQTNVPLTLFVAKDSVQYLNHLTLDFVKKALGQSQLTYLNPNETAKCGCGESFSVDEAKK